MPKPTNKKYQAKSIITYKITATNQKEAEEKFWDKIGYLSYRLVEKIKENLKIEETKK